MTTPHPPPGSSGDPWVASEPGAPGTASYPQGGSLPPYPGASMPPPYAAGGPPGLPGYPKASASAPGGPPPRPTTVSAAFWLWMATMVSGAISSVLLLTGDYYDTVVSATNAQLNSENTGVALQITSSVLVIGSVIGMVISLFIYLFFGIKMVLGRNWSRIVLAVLGGLSVLSSVAGGGLTATVSTDVAIPAIPQTLSWIGIIFAAIALVLMFLPPSNTYFKASKVYRSAPMTVHPMGGTMGGTPPAP